MINRISVSVFRYRVATINLLGRVCQSDIGIFVSNRYDLRMEESRALDLLERISNLLRAESRAAAHRAGLQPVHLEILEYLAKSNRYSDTPAAVADFLGITKGTASQSILRLEEKGLIEREVDASDRRISHLRLTTSGKREAQGAWRRALENESADLAMSAKGTLEEQLAATLRSFQSANGYRSFGVCQSCRFFERRGAKSYRCGLTQERLSMRETEQICREHEYVGG